MSAFFFHGSLPVIHCHRSHFCSQTSKSGCLKWTYCVWSSNCKGVYCSNVNWLKHLGIVTVSVFVDLTRAFNTQLFVCYLFWFFIPDNNATLNKRNQPPHYENIFMLLDCLFLGVSLLDIYHYFIFFNDEQKCFGLWNIILVSRTVITFCIVMNILSALVGILK